jgi:hypothetical protein
MDADSSENIMLTTGEFKASSLTGTFNAANNYWGHWAGPRGQPDMWLA